MNLAGHIVVSSRLLPQLLGMSVDRTAARAMIRYGGAFVIGAIAGVALINAEKGILASTVSTTALAYYSVAFSFAIMLTLFSGSMVQSLFPAFSQLQGTEKRFSSTRSIRGR
ncbi:MAG: oligosaccharide flippase family protein [Chloracidobacterium sp.]|nr:oligosaccharide flippase family protein [Chloracidobacterium sp.]